MPIYEYECEKCSDSVEVLEPLEKKPESCSKCDGEMKSKIGKTSFVLKGRGWERDGYR